MNGLPEAASGRRGRRLDSLRESLLDGIDLVSRKYLLRLL